MRSPAFTLLPAILLCLSLLSGRACAQVVPFIGGLDYFLNDRSLWELPAGELAEKLKPSGYVANATTGVISLGEPKDMLKQKACLFDPELPVWKVILTQGTTLRTVTLDFLPPAALARTPDKPGFRTLARRLEERLTAVMKSQPAIHLNDGDPPPAGVKVTSQRWIGEHLQVVLITTAVDSRVFVPQRLDLKIMLAVKPGKPAIAKAPVMTMDKASGVATLQGMPPVPAWPGSHPEYGVLEQALEAIGKTSDRNGIIEYYSRGSAWPVVFTYGLQQLAVMAGAKMTAIVPQVHGGAELAKLTRNCQAAAKKIKKNAPEVLGNIIDVDPEVLRLARTGGTAVPQFTAALKQALSAGRPLIWLGWRGFLPELPPVEGPMLAIRLIIGYAPKEGDVIFADASLFVGDVSAK